jgi:hypothetical protein
MTEQTFMLSRQPDAIALADSSFVLGFSAAAALTLRALTCSCAVEALSAVAGPFTLNTLTGSTAHIAFCSLFHRLAFPCGRISNIEAETGCDCRL